MVKREVSNHAVICPVNRRKLMEVKSKRKPIVEICEKGFEGKYDLITKCPTCKSYVGVII